MDWLLDSPEPWTRYRSLLDLFGCAADDLLISAARQEMLAHPKVQELIARASTWGESPLKRHNDASHPLYALIVLADFGLQHSDPGMSAVIDRVLAHQSPQGAVQTLVFIPKAFGGSDTDSWSWMACDAPTLLYALASFGLEDDPRLQLAADHLATLSTEVGYRCVVSPELGKFHGPGRRADPCPIANLFALKALACFPRLLDSPAARQASEMLLAHWAAPRGQKYYLFGVGSDYRKLKYPFVWYDLLHAVEVLSHFPIAYTDKRFMQMLETVQSQADDSGRYTAGSMYQSWKGWSFADKKNPSPWLTFLVLSIQKRVNRG